MKEKSATKCLDFRQMKALLLLCKENGIQEIEYRGVHLVFGNKSPIVSTKKAKELLSTDDKDQMILTDPGEFMKQMESGGLE